jgi:two-component system response regulator NreC
MAVRIITADDQQIVRQALGTLLEKEPDMEVVAEAEDGVRIMILVREFIPDLVIMDVRMPNLNGIEATRQIRSEFPDIKVIVFSTHNDNGFITNMLKAGVHGYLLKDCAYEELLQAIRLTMAGKTYLSPGATEVLVKDYISQDSNPIRSSFSELTPREREVLQMIAEANGPTKLPTSWA